MTPSTRSSTLGFLALVSETESPSQLRPALIHKTWTTVSLSPLVFMVPSCSVRRCEALVSRRIPGGGLLQEPGVPLVEAVAGRRGDLEDAEARLDGARVRDAAPEVERHVGQEIDLA